MKKLKFLYQREIQLGRSDLDASILFSLNHGGRAYLMLILEILDSEDSSSLGLIDAADIQKIPNDQPLVQLPIVQTH